MPDRTSDSPWILLIQPTTCVRSAREVPTLEMTNLSSALSTIPSMELVIDGVEIHRLAHGTIQSKGWHSWEEASRGLTDKSMSLVDEIPLTVAVNLSTPPEGAKIQIPPTSRATRADI